MRTLSFARGLSLQAKVMSIILFSIILVLSASGAYRYNKQYKEFTSDLTDRAENIGDRLEKTLVLPLWDMDSESAQKMLRSEMSQKLVYALIALDESGKNIFAGLSRDDAWDPKPVAEDVKPKGYIVTERDILHKGKPIGKIKVFVTKKFMQESLDSTLANIAVETALVGVFVIGILFLVLRYYIMTPLCLMRRFAGQVAEGNLDYRLESGNFTSELLELKDSIESMVGALTENLHAVQEKQEEAENLSRQANAAAQEAEQARQKAETARREGLTQAAGNLEEIVEKVTSSSGELASQVEGVSQGAQLQADQVRETATAMEEMNATVLEVASNAGDTSAMALKARERAEEGSEIVRQTMNIIKEVDSSSSSLKDRIGSLGACAKDVGQILSVINDIADQTNLLALNAAIEAARAGDAGRGFAVVADEVRKLAEKTVQATKQVEQSIKAIQNGTEESIKITEDTVAVVQKANEYAESSGHALEEILQIVNATSQQVEAIATAAEQQSATSEEINRRIDEINRITQETTQGMETSAMAVGELASLSNGIKRLVDDLKAEGTA